MKGMCLQILGFCSLFLMNPIKCHVIHKRSDLSTIPAPTKETTVPLLPTTTPPPTTTSPTEISVPPGCFEGGKWYAPGDEVSQGSDGYGWCYGTYCNHNGNLIAWDNWDCLPTTKPSTAPPMHHQGCFHRGKWYDPGDEVSQGSDGNGWCCDANGNLIPWDGWNCQPDKTTPQETTRTTTNEATTEEMTTKETTTAQKTTTKKTTTQETTREETTTQETTISPAYPTTLPDTTVLTTQEGCYNNGIWYPLNSQISLIKSGQMCFGFLCDHAGNIVPKMCTNCGSILDCP